MSFSINPLTNSQQKALDAKKVRGKVCPVKAIDLRVIKVDHYNFVGDIIEGEIIVHQLVAESTANIFQELFKLQFPIYSVITMDQFNDDDNLAMQKNNSSGFNFRVIEGQELLSMHSYGLAIDINPMQNPYIFNDENNSLQIMPLGADSYQDRKELRPGMVEQVVDIFSQYGFTDWGGNWNNIKDYHHFQIPRKEISLYLK